jgi:lysophospholipase L1-like esterase
MTSWLPTAALCGFGGGLLLASTAAGAPAPAAPIDDGPMRARALVSEGDTIRLQRALAKARRGQAVTVGVIGGSITQGASASAEERRYGNLVARWWRTVFPQARIDFVNAGIGATGSNYGALRVQRDLLARQPDLVVVEYGVNDGNTQACAESVEGLVRQVLSSANQPAVVLLFTMHRNGTNAQEWQGKVGAHYGLPMVSFRDALWPEIEAGRIKWEEVEADIVHPNDRGHAYMAEFVISLLERVRKALPVDAELPAVAPVPQPLFSDLFETVDLREADALQTVSNQGWVYDQAQGWNRCWKSDKPGSVIEFEIDGQLLLTMHWVVRGGMGRARVSVDGGSPRTLDGWFDQTWGGYRQTNELARNLSPGRHQVRFELLAEKSQDSTGCEFRILGLGAGGVKR